MIKYSFRYLFMLLVVFFSACSSFLEEKPKDSKDANSIFNSFEDLRNSTVLTVYNHIGGVNNSEGLQGTGRGVYDLNTMTTDEAIMPTRGADWYDGGFWQGLYLHKWGVNNEAIADTWEYLYGTIMLCNKSLSEVATYKSIHPESDINALTAELRALRAMFYYYTMDLFGRIPLITDIEVSGSDMVQVKRSEMFFFIVKELQESVPYLSENRSNALGEYYGRMTQPVAYFLLAKLALNSEVYADNNWTDGKRPSGKDILFSIEGEKKNAWETVVYYGEKIKTAGYALEASYITNFAVHNEKSIENIFVIPMDKHLYTNQFIYLFRSRNYNHAVAYGLFGENGTSATPEALSIFGYGTPQQDARFDYCYYAGNVMDMNGKQIYLDDGKTPLVYEAEKVALDVSGEPFEKTAGARMKKYEVDLKAYMDGKLCDNDIVLFRYADVLLMMSEAKVRNGQNGDAELNEVRARVGEEPRIATLDNILNERMLELAWEGWRRQDLIRFQQFTRAYSFRPVLEDEDSGYTTVFPIPYSIVNQYDGIKQNYLY